MNKQYICMVPHCKFSMRRGKTYVDYVLRKNEVVTLPSDNVAVMVLELKRMIAPCQFDGKKAPKKAQEMPQA